MSIRTIIVGLLATICGVSATVGVMILNSDGSPTPTSSLVVAAVDIDLGAEVQENMLKLIEWHSEDFPAGAVDDVQELVGKFAVKPVTTGDFVSTSTVADSPTNLSPSSGKVAFAIETKTASSNVGKNLVPGNRVDILWTTDRPSRTLSGPITARLLQNVKILAVGKIKGDIDGDQKSVTLEVTPKMDENLSYAQAFGRLDLVLRNPADHDDFDSEPYEATNLRSVLEAAQKKEAQAAQQKSEPSKLEVAIQQLGSKFLELENKITNASQEPVDQNRTRYREALQRIPQGMRAVTILTPNESTGVAGLLEPGDRVDLVFALGRNTVLLRSFTNPNDIPAETLIENIEVLAVDTKLDTVQGDDEKENSRSVTLIVSTQMARDITKASQLGSMTLILRGDMDNDESGPKIVLSIDQFIQRYRLRDEVATERPIESPVSKSVNVRVIRGRAVNDSRYFVPVDRDAESLSKNETR